MSIALLVVDFQNDFVDGSLAVPDAEATVKPILELAESPEISVIVLSRDWHPEDHVSFSDSPEFKDYSWPPHCVQDTYGAEFHNGFSTALNRIAHDRGVPVIIATKGDDQAKEAYSAFDGTVPVMGERVDGDGESRGYEEPAKLATVLDVQYGVDTVYVVGLALDYCVRATALDARRADFATFVDLNGTRPVAYATGTKAVLDLIANNVHIFPPA